MFIHLYFRALKMLCFRFKHVFNAVRWDIKTYCVLQIVCIYYFGTVISVWLYQYINSVIQLQNVIASDTDSIVKKTEISTQINV
jgi:hypothetical protein